VEAGEVNGRGQAGRPPADDQAVENGIIHEAAQWIAAPAVPD
jgi:hypothetical protein